MILNLKDIRISRAHDYHILEGKSLYPQRFQKVLNFHPPGLAPVKDISGSYHIDTKGDAAYADRYKNTFGFYEGVATVTTESGWCHITPEGIPIYQHRYEWCGNFQEQRCCVRNQKGNYFHILSNGAPLYSDSYLYAGDYKDGIAVVCRSDGKSSHIDLEGTIVHNNWYEQLDIFHKGFARAKDEKGWFHVNLDGKPAYDERFKSLETFYNGQGHAETLKGDLVVINEKAETTQIIWKQEKNLVGALSRDLGWILEFRNH